MVLECISLLFTCRVNLLPPVSFLLGNLINQYCVWPILSLRHSSPLLQKKTNMTNDPFDLDVFVVFQSLIESASVPCTLFLLTVLCMFRCPTPLQTVTAFSIEHIACTKLHSICSLYYVSNFDFR